MVLGRGRNDNHFVVAGGCDLLDLPESLSHRLIMMTIISVPRTAQPKPPADINITPARIAHSLVVGAKNIPIKATSIPAPEMPAQMKLAEFIQSCGDGFAEAPRDRPPDDSGPASPGSDVLAPVSSFDVLEIAIQNILCVRRHSRLGNSHTT